MAALPAKPAEAVAESSSTASAARSDRARRIAVGVFALALSAVLFECSVRVDDWLRYQTPFLSPYREQADLFVRDIDGVHGRSRARYRKWSMNSQGTRGPEFSLQPATGVFRIAVIGASEAFGLYESPDQEFPRELERQLNDLRASRRCRCEGIERFEVVNGAIPGMATPTISQDVRTRITRYSPRMVVYYTSPVQYLDFDAPVAAAPDSSVPRNSAVPLSWYLRPRMALRLKDALKQSAPTAVLDAAREILIGRALAAPTATTWSNIPSDRLDAYRSDLSGSIDAVRAIGATPLLVTHGNAFQLQESPDKAMLTSWRKFYPRAEGRVIIEFDSASAQVTREVARTKGVSIYDWFSAVARLSTTPFQDFCHLNDAGSRILSKALAIQIASDIDSDSTHS